MIRGLLSRALTLKTSATSTFAGISQARFYGEKCPKFGVIFLVNYIIYFI